MCSWCNEGIASPSWAGIPGGRFSEAPRKQKPPLLAGRAQSRTQSKAPKAERTEHKAKRAKPNKTRQSALSRARRLGGRPAIPTSEHPEMQGTLAQRAKSRHLHGQAKNPAGLNQLAARDLVFLSQVKRSSCWKPGSPKGRFLFLPLYHSSLGQGQKGFLAVQEAFVIKGDTSFAKRRASKTGTLDGLTGNPERMPTAGRVQPKFGSVEPQIQL